MRVELVDVSYSVPGRALFTAVTHTFAAPATIALMGPSGSGKSTLLGLISRQLAPDQGTVRAEHDGSQVAPAWIFQSTPLLVHRTALDNAMTAALMTGHDPIVSRRRAAEALERVGLGGLASTHASRLSGGERQRVAVARAITARSRLVLADEPTASLDPVSRERVVDALRSAREFGALTLVATHDAWVADNCDARVMIEDGTLVGY
ncbi:ATP-binding cassette domain-containing protein [Sinomonas sp. ASV322]|uniref:ATP-binding cassette domain-containing protein n=1 Tax=Sinomonas sp. ASV322 TaxID=3041920 RepID=UPI0027DAFCB5|nr:ATP-binding cassette domain-containing protein [Sinomonas sp. ASV322]MDQ4502615.1 ATP-binding cassette domain-containing protein [Sinomonas sp. ASV322]